LPSPHIPQRKKERKTGGKKERELRRRKRPDMLSQIDEGESERREKGLKGGGSGKVVWGRKKFMISRGRGGS